ncbi:MAG: hypothetical protein ACE5GY_10930, partial [Thermodesulfobacteriota bacterium]
EAYWMRNLHKTIGTAKGAAVSEAGRKKNRLNGFTTGSALMRPFHRGKIPLPPAKPGKYAECDGCHDLDECERNVAEKRGTCVPVYCHRKSEVALKYASSFLSGDPEMMRLVAANNAARMQQVLDNSYKKIFDRGVEVIEKVLHHDKNGDVHRDENGAPFVVEKIYAHPLIKRCIEIMQVMGFTLTDWTMTPKSKEAKEQVAGFLAGMAAGSGKNAEEVSRDIQSSVNKFIDSLAGAKELRDKDETLKGFEAEQGKREGHE